MVDINTDKYIYMLDFPVCDFTTVINVDPVSPSVRPYLYHQEFSLKLECISVLRQSFSL